MVIQKKHGKGRLDKWYKLAKEKGYRARSAFKLVQLNKKYGFLEQSRVVIDLCAAPGSWCQVAAETMPVDSIIIGVDLVPIKPIPKVITFQGDITTDKCRATIRQHLGKREADTVLHDGAPNVGVAWLQDSYSQAELTLQSLKLATDFLIKGGTFVTKVFRSKDYNPLLWVFNQLFEKVEATKPPSSRNVSAEIFVVCRGFKAPKRIDPRFLDPKSVFADLKDPTPNNEAKVYKPEIKKRKREGYAEGDYTQFKEVPASEFIQATDPIAILASINRLAFTQPGNGDVALAALNKLPETTPEVREACKDLKVLGRSDFKMLLKWRLKVREIFGFPSAKALAAEEEKEKEQQSEEVTRIVDMEDELQIQEELQAMKAREDARKKKERRKDNDKKHKEIVRMQMHMVAPMDIGMEQDGPLGPDSLFALKAVDKVGVGKIAKGKMAIIKETEAEKNGIVVSEDVDYTTDEEEDNLETQLDQMYDMFKENKAARDAAYRAKRARKEFGDDEWEGLSADGDAPVESDNEEIEEESGSDSDDDMADTTGKLLVDLDDTETHPNGLSKRAQSFFSRDIFKGIADEDDNEELTTPTPAPTKQKKAKDSVAAKKMAEHESAVSSGDDDDDLPSIQQQKKAQELAKTNKKAVANLFNPSDDSADESDGRMEIVRANDTEWEEEQAPGGQQPNIDIITAEAMTLAHELATGQRTSTDVVDQGFNRWSFRDRDGLPDWFLDDESKHDKPLRPITKAAAQAIKDKLRALNARPIKKVREAKARKKLKVAQRLEKLRKKSDLLVEEDGLTEKEKAENIQKMMAGALRKKPRRETRLVVARGINRGIAGRPKGVKGRYKIVDRRMKKDMKGLKRAAAKAKKR